MSTSVNNSTDLSATFSRASDSVNDIFCYPCLKDGVHLEAVGYCCDCQDYLCQECYDVHLKPRPCRHHVLLDKSNMPYDMPYPHQVGNKDACNEPCTLHNNKILKYNCVDHDKLGCSVCMTLNHSNCKNKEYIPEVAKDVVNTTEYWHTNDTIKSQISTIQQAIKTIQDQKNKSKKLHSEAIQTFDKLRKDMNAALDKIEAGILKDTNIIRNEDEKRLQSVEEQYTNLLKDIKDLEDKMSDLQNAGHYCQLYMALKNSKHLVDTFDSISLPLIDDLTITEYNILVPNNLHELMEKIQIAKIEINKDQTSLNESEDAVHSPQSKTQHSLNTTPTAHHSQSEHPTGMANSEECKMDDQIVQSKIVVSANENQWHLQHSCTESMNQEPTACHIADIELTSSIYTFKSITGLAVLQDGKLVVVVKDKYKVQLIDMQSHKEVSHLEHDCELWDIATSTDNEVVVTSPAKHEILFIKVAFSWLYYKHTLTISHVVKVRSKCMGIAYVKNKFIVTYKDSAKIEILNRKGEQLQTIVTEDQGKQLFTSPNHVAVSHDLQAFYVSDHFWDTVTKLSIGGEVQATYRNDTLKMPGGLTVDKAGRVYVCGYNSNNIHIFSSDLQESQILLHESDGIRLPKSVSYSGGEKDRLYIGTTKRSALKSDVSIVKIYDLNCSHIKVFQKLSKDYQAFQVQEDA